MNEMFSTTNTGWNELRPMIDEALSELGDTDRKPIVLPYFESLEFSLVGMALGVSENAARKRVDRALEKLRAVLQKRGLTTTSAVLAGALAESSAAMAPLHLGRRNHRRGADSILGTLHGLARPGSFSTDLASL